MSGSAAIAIIRSEEAARPAPPHAPPAVVISCTGHAAIKGEGGIGGADAVWSKPFPDFTNGAMQRQLAALLATWPPRIDSPPQGDGGGEPLVPAP